uniref:Malate dehydrogenase, putative n=1 Tax=Entamoeba histolytica TaxID=5759 RepID=A0A060N4N2_ENTHI|nr:malate dehydrogenase, putative [Entamoeba histolytica]
MSTSQTKNVSIDTIKEFMYQVLLKVGSDEENARMVRDTLIAADLRGMDTHGIQRFKTVYIDRIKKGMINPTAKPSIIRETSTTCVLDGNNGFGHVNGTIGMKMAIEKAKKYGMGMVVVRNSTHFGIAGYYSLLAAQEGCIGICGTNARSSVAATFGDEPILGTNPLAIGIPSDEAFPYCFDGATSISPTGRFEKYVRMGKTVDKSWASMKGGKPIEDPKELLENYPKGKAYLHPLGGSDEVSGSHKGYCLSEFVEIMSSCLSIANFINHIEEEKEKSGKFSLGHFFIAINVECFRDLNEFKKNVGDINRTLRNTDKLPGHDRIYTAGEEEYETEQKRRKFGDDLPLVTINEMKELSSFYNVPLPF